VNPSDVSKFCFIALSLGKLIVMKFIKGSLVLLSSLLLVLVVLGCQPQVPDAEPTPTPTPAELEPSPVLTPAITPFTPTPIQTASTPTAAPLVPTATPEQVDPGCVPIDEGITLPHHPYRQIPEAVLDFLNQGGSLEALDEGLYEAGIASQPVAAAQADFTGNGKQDVVISIFDPFSPATPPGGRLVIYTCANGAYELSFTELSPEMTGAPGIRFIEDLSGDGRQEIVASSPVCGAHTCFEDVHILGWDGEAFTHRMVGETDDLPYPLIDLEEKEDGTFDLVITGSGIGSVGAGPQRDQVRRWSYQPTLEQWVVVEEEKGESNYRIHILHDADEAAEEGEYETALRYYQRVVSDTTLDDWIDPDREREILSAYARFRMSAIYHIRGQEQFGEMILREMEQNYPPASPHHAFVEMARSFRETYTSQGLEAACRSVKSFARNNEQAVLVPLGPEEFGYGNPVYTPEDVCPW
jgi:hypothetical protein